MNSNEVINISQDRSSTSQTVEEKVKKIEISTPGNNPKTQKRKIRHRPSYYRRLWTEEVFIKRRIKL